MLYPYVRAACGRQGLSKLIQSGIAPEKGGQPRAGNTAKRDTMAAALKAQLITCIREYIHSNVENVSTRHTFISMVDYLATELGTDALARQLSYLSSSLARAVSHLPVPAFLQRLCGTSTGAIELDHLDTATGDVVPAGVHLNTLDITYNQSSGNYTKEYYMIRAITEHLIKLDALSNLSRANGCLTVPFDTPTRSRFRLELQEMHCIERAAVQLSELCDSSTHAESSKRKETHADVDATLHWTEVS